MLKLLTTGDAARRLDRSVTAVRDLALSGSLPVAATTPGGLRLFREVDVEELRQRRAAHPPRPGRPRSVEREAA
jgi:DNA-binding transcriptional MerR regulator